MGKRKKAGGKRSKKARATQAKLDRRDKKKARARAQKRAEKKEKLARIRQSVRHFASKSKDGLARATACSHRQEPLANDEFLDVMSLSPRRWEDLGDWTINSVLAWKWVPHRPKSPLEELAEAAG